MKKNLWNFYWYILIGLAFFACEQAETTVETWENGQAKKVHIVDKADVYETNFYPDGQIKSKGLLKDGDKEKVWHSYHPNGQLQEETYYRAGTPFQETTKYYPNGQLQLKGFYNDFGIPEEYWVFYYENGNLLSHGSYLNGEPTGKWIYYSEKGKRESEEFYRDRQLTLQKDYDPTGSLIAKINFYHSGVKMEELLRDSLSNNHWLFRSYYENGQIESQGLIQNEERIGEWSFWNKYGDKLAISSNELDSVDSNE